MGKVMIYSLAFFVYLYYYYLIDIMTYYQRKD